MKSKINNRQFLSIIILLFYLVPVLFFASYSIGLMSRHKSWSILSFGLLIMICGALILILLLYYWEEAQKEKNQQEKVRSVLEGPSIEDDKPNKVTSLDSHLLKTTNKEEALILENSLKETQEKSIRLMEEVQNKNQALHHLEEENKQLIQKANQVAQDFADYKIFSEEQLKQKNLQINLFQQTIEEQKAEMERHQEQIQLLDTKVHDLSYEIKTLLHLNEIETPSSKQTALYAHDSSVKIAAIHSENNSFQQTSQICAILTDVPEGLVKISSEASELLKRCLHSAQKLTGANYYGNESSRYREISSPYYTIDQRRLFDNLRSETSGLILVYSQKEHKPIFVNNQCKTLLGWSPEKFIQDFSLIIQEGLSEWKRALNLLASAPESQARLLMKTKNGQELLLNCHVGTISTGLFKNYVVAILYPA